MAENAIDVVRKAETEAEEVVRAAVAEAARIVDDAHSEAVRIAGDARDKAQDDAAASIAGAHKGSQALLERSLADLAGEMDALAQMARAKQATAVRVILDSLSGSL